MNYTANYNLKKPEATDTVNIQEFNDNADIIDTALAGKLNSNANAASASKLAAARTISVSGDVTGSVSFDGSSNANIVASVADDSHNHIIGNVDGLQTALDGVDAKLKAHDNKFVETSNLVSNKANKSTEVTATFLAASWSGTSAPYTYTLSVTGVTATSNQELLPSKNITAVQLKALQLANIQDYSQAANSITVRAWGSKPTIDLPIRIIKRGDA